jgi:hypothetical protein
MNLDDDGRIKLIEDKQQKKQKNERKSNSDDELRKSKHYNGNENGYESDSSPKEGTKNKKTNNKKIDRLNLYNDEEGGDDDDVTTIRKPKIVTAYESDEERRADEARKPIKQQQMNQNENLGGSSLIEKKKLKWQADKQARDQLQQQEIFDRQKFNQSKNKKIEKKKELIIYFKNSFNKQRFKSKCNSKNRTYTRATKIRFINIRTKKAFTMGKGKRFVLIKLN